MMYADKTYPWLGKCFWHLVALIFTLFAYYSKCVFDSYYTQQTHTKWIIQMQFCFELYLNVIRFHSLTLIISGMNVFIWICTRPFRESVVVCVRIFLCLYHCFAVTVQSCICRYCCCITSHILHSLSFNQNPSSAVRCVFVFVDRL